jgi:biofilm PGA synthesis lipoprotein PgaB
MRLILISALTFFASFTVAEDVNFVTPDKDVNFVTLGYHEVRDNLAINYDRDRYAVTSENLAAHFRWLKSRGYTVVSVDQILSAREGVSPLPEKAVLLSFDDGFASVYTHVFPLLKTFGYFAIVSPVTSWIESDQTILYAGEELAQDSFLTWEQMRIMQTSGLVEIASHSHNLHRGVPGNPQGNEQPAAVTLAIKNGNYERTGN